jgi:hypothetical protein
MYIYPFDPYCARCSWLFRPPVECLLCKRLLLLVVDDAFDESVTENFSSSLWKNGFLKWGDDGDLVVEVAVYIEPSGAFTV